jgi:hypothetical protein
MRLLPIGFSAIVAACGGGSVAELPSLAATVGTADCGAIVAEYSTALLDAMRCDPAASDACGAQYPLAVKGCDEMMSCSFESLCWTAYVGYVNPARTARLDELIRSYTAAGCAIGACPGPPPHVTRCMQDAAGAFTCGGT